MSRIFITPKPEELVEGGLAEDSVAEADVGQAQAGTSGGEEQALEEVEGVADTPLAEDYKTLWKGLQGLSLEQTLQRVALEVGSEPQRKREVLVTWMAQELGYSRLTRGGRRVTTEPLWDILDGRAYSELSSDGEQALWHIARSLRPHRTSLNSMAALAAIALWRHSQDEELLGLVEELLMSHALPDEPRWLYELAREFEANTSQPGRDLQDLIALQLKARFWEIAATLCGMYLVRRYAPWYAGSASSNLTRACDIAAQQHPFEVAPWLQLMADAAIGGRLTLSWLERPLQACIRLSVQDAERQTMLREFDELRLYEADYRRLETLYGSRFQALGKGDSAKVSAQLVAEVERTVVTNPTRAQRLLELCIVHHQSRRVGTLEARLRSAIGGLGRGEVLDSLEEKLISLYVRNYALDSYAVELVRRGFERVDWTHNSIAGADDLEMYLVISNYERAFEQLTCKFDGVTLEHADKHAAARTKYFVEKRLDPNTLTRVVRRLFTPFEWLGASIAEIDLISDTVERGMQLFEARTAQIDLTEQVLLDFRAAGIDIEDYEAVGALTVARIDTVLKRQRSNRLLLGAVAGGLSGGLAPFSWGILSIADVPIVLGITGDICSRFCWYYGFDPRQHPELPLEILAVALGGSRPAAIEPMLVRQNLSEYVLQKSIMVGALSKSGVTHVAGRSMSQLVERHMGRKSVERITAIARREVSRNLQRRAAEAAPSKTLPMVGAVLGAALNTALIYDICEAAQAVLTDRFLERKYPEWVRHVSTNPVTEDIAKIVLED